MAEGGKTSVSNYDLDGNSFRNTMHSLNYGNVMEAAARNYMKEVKAEEAAAANVGPIQYDLEDLEDDPELHQLHKERIQQMKEEQEKRREMQRKGHGEYRDIDEGEFLDSAANCASSSLASFLSSPARLHEKASTRPSRTRSPSRLWERNAVSADRRGFSSSFIVPSRAPAPVQR